MVSSAMGALAILAMVAVALTLPVALIWLLVKGFQGIYWLLGKVFLGIGAFAVHVFTFVKSTFVDVLGFVGGVFSYYALKILFNLLLDLFDYITGSSI